MGGQYKQVGGRPQSGLPQDFTNFLEQGLNTGHFGPGFAAGGSSVGSTMGIAGILNDVLSGGAGQLGGSLQKILQQQQTSDVNSLRSRFGAGGGTAFGTPAAYAESQYRAQAAPQITSAIGNLQLQALSPLLAQMGALTQRGTPQAENVFQPSALMQGLGIAAPIAGGLLAGPVGASLGGLFSQGFSGGGGMGGFSPSNINFGSEFNPSLSGMLGPGLSGSSFSSGFSPTMVPNFNPYLTLGR